MHTLRQNWVFVTALVSALVGTAYAVLGWVTPVLPPQTGDVWYWGVWWFNYTALPAAILVLMGVMFAAFFWLPQALVRGPHHRRDGLMVALSTVALVACTITAWPLLTTIYRELEVVEHQGQTYVLGVYVAPPERRANLAVLCQCSAAGWQCRCQHVRDAVLDTFSTVPRLRLQPAGPVQVLVDDRVIYEAPR